MLSAILPCPPLARRFVLGLFSATAPTDETPDNVVPIERADWLGARDFARVPSEWISSLAPTLLRVAIALALHADKRTGRLWVSYARLAVLTGCDRRRVMGAVARLERLKVVTRLGLKRKGGVQTFQLARSVVTDSVTPSQKSRKRAGGEPRHRVVTFAVTEGDAGIPDPEPTPSNKSKEPIRCASRTSPATPATAESSSPGGTNEVPPARARARKASAVLYAAWCEIVENVPDLGVTEKGWRQRNKAGALELVDRGRAPANVAAMLRMAHTHPAADSFWRRVSGLDSLAEHWDRLAEINAATGTKSENAHAQVEA